jgi:hypothetical protein
VRVTGRSWTDSAGVGVSVATDPVNDRSRECLCAGHFVRVGEGSVGARRDRVSGMTLAILAGGVILVAVGWIVITRHSADIPVAREPSVVWMRPVGHPLAHAFDAGELRIGLTEVQALAHCGPWPVGELVRDDHAERCLPCLRAERMEHRNP